MQVTVHEQVGNSLVLLIEGASCEQVLDAYWNGLKRPFQGRVSVIGLPRIGTRPDGSLLMRCELNQGVSGPEIVSEMRFQLTHYAKSSA